MAIGYRLLPSSRSHCALDQIAWRKLEESIYGEPVYKRIQRRRRLAKVVASSSRALGRAAAIAAANFAGNSG